MRDERAEEGGEGGKKHPAERCMGLTGVSGEGLYHCGGGMGSRTERVCDQGEVSRGGSTVLAAFCFLERKVGRGTCVAQLVKCLTSTQVMILRSVGLSPPHRALCLQLRAWSLLQILSPSLSALPLLMLCPPLSKIKT